MNIVVLDGYTMNPGDLSWDGLRSLGSCTMHDRTSAAEIVQRSRDAEIILTNKVPLTREILAQLPRLKYIGVIATGYNVVDIAAARERNITVTNVPAYCADSAAQLVFALVLELTHHTGHHVQAVREGRWSGQPDFSFWDFPLLDLSGKTFGIVGYGNIGRAVAKIAAAFGMTVLISTRTAPKQISEILLRPEFTDTESLLKRSDFVSLHCTLTSETEGLIDARRLGMMKRSAFLINTSRGGLVNEAALADALNSGTLAGAGLDVLSVEPPSRTNPLLNAKNCIITPHIAWATQTSRQRLMESAVENIRSFLSGQARNIVS